MNRDILCCVELTDSCNYNCSFCCKKNRKSQNGNMSISRIKKIIDMGADRYLITGGEPFLAKENFIYFTKNNKKPYTINTNLSLITDEIFTILCNNNLLSCVNIDYPSCDKAIYNTITNTNGFFEKVSTNLAKIVALIPIEKIKITIVITEENKNNWENTILYLSSKYGIRNFIVSIQISKKIHLQQNEKEHIYKNIWNFIENHQSIIIKTLAKTYYSGSCPITHKCSAGVDRFVVIASGDIVPCAWEENTVIGNIDTDNLDTILKNGTKYFNSFNEKEKCICKGTL